MSEVSEADSQLYPNARYPEVTSIGIIEMCLIIVT
jgi:hypothetical protein